MNQPSTGWSGAWYQLKRWMYRGGRPRACARAINRVYGWLFAQRWFRWQAAATLEVMGRRTGAVVSLPVVVTEVHGERYLVSMLGDSANWVLNVRANGQAALVRGRRRRRVRLVELPAAERAPVLERYLAIAPGARPHVAVDRRAPRAEFEAVAGDYPVFRIEEVDPA